MTGYVPISKGKMNDTLIHDMGFTISDTDRAGEMVYVRDVITKSGVEFPYQIKVYSTVLWNTGWTDDVGQDAIRVVLLDKVTNRPAAGKQKRVNRTKNALVNLRARCRDLFKQVLEAPKCPCCGAIMIERENRKTGHKFLSCSRYAPGKPYHCVNTSELPQI